MKTSILIPVQKNPEATHLQFKVWYDKGGSSCFSDRISRRGIYMSATPIIREDHFMKQKLFTGLKQLVEEMGRASDKKLTAQTTRLLHQVESRSGEAWNLIEKVLLQEGLKLEEVVVNG